MLGRRSFLLGLSVAGCSRCDRDANGAPTAQRAATPSATVLPPVVPETPPIADGGVGVRGQVRTETWTLPGDGRAVAIVPTWAAPDAKLPMLFALHGRGEANKGPALGVMGWPKDYALLRAIERVCAPPLTTEDFERMVDAKRLVEHNESLARQPFAGLVVVCPYSPDVDLRKPPQIREYAAYFMNVVLPRAKKELPVLGTPPSIGIDGVSLGGALALRIGLGNPEAFGALGTLQAAVGDDQVPELTELARAARAKNPDLALRLLTSDKDYFRRALRKASTAWRAAGIEHDFEEVPGVHDYPFNRGPGAIEMLLWHDRRLARA
ncbi:MAG: esterase [Labilithrix sp.]|nr:esterase [Labilithrix sp.]